MITPIPRSPGAIHTEVCDPVCDSAPAESTAAARAERVAADAGVSHRIASRLEPFIGDMFSLIEAFQIKTRDSQGATQERESSGRARTAAEAHDQRVAETERAVIDRARAAESGVIGDIFRVIGSAISLAVGAVGAIFTGGATLVAAIAVVVALVGPLVMNELGRQGVVEPEIAAAVGLGIAAVCTAVSFGCAAASLAGAVASAALVVVEAAVKAAIEVATNVAAMVGGLADVTAGALQVGTATLDRDAATHQIEATQHGHRRDEEQELQEEALEILAQLMRSFSRVSTSLAETREEGTRAARAALTFA